MVTREQWGTRVGFVLAAVGSAIGLGNIWRFPYMAYENGGGAFFIPYLFALLTAGIPIMILEFAVGHKYRGSAPLTFFRINPKWEWLGWWQVFVSFFISVYYVVIIGWAISFTYFSLSLAWGSNPTDFFVSEYLGLTGSPFELGGFRWGILAAVAIAWFINYVVLQGGVKKGIETANKIFMPLLFILTVVMAIRGITLPGAAEGLNYLFQPDFSRILDYKVWTAAYGQIFFTLSICFAIMITYSSYLPRKSDIVNNGFMTAFINCGFSLLAGLAVFGVLGFMAHQQGAPFNEVVQSGVMLAFTAFPMAISQMPVAPELFGTIFFLSLVFAGLTSEISINEAVISSLMDKFNAPRKKVVNIYCLVAFAFSMIFVTGAGLYILDIVDYFVNNFGIVFAGLIEIILLSWLFNLNSIREYMNPMSDFQVGKWWNFMLKVVTPVVLGYMAIANLYGNITTPYGGYPVNALLLLGWLVFATVVVLGFVMQSVSWKEKKLAGQN